MFDDILDKVGEPYTGGGKGFERGTHEVIIGMVELEERKTANNPKAEVITVTVVDPNDSEKTAKATLYFHTPGGAKMSVTKILGIFVHNVPEDKKDKVRELGRKVFGDIDDLSKAREKAAELMNAKMTGKKAFAHSDPSGNYKTSNFVDLWHYEYKPKEEGLIESGKDVTGTAEEPELPDFGDDI